MSKFVAPSPSPLPAMAAIGSIRGETTAYMLTWVAPFATGAVLALIMLNSMGMIDLTVPPAAQVTAVSSQMEVVTCKGDVCTYNGQGLREYRPKSLVRLP